MIKEDVDSPDEDGDSSFLVMMKVIVFLGVVYLLMISSFSHELFFASYSRKEGKSLSLFLVRSCS